MGTSCASISSPAGSSRFAHGGTAHRGRRERGRLTLTRPGAGGKRYKHAAAAGTTAQAGGADVGAGAYKVLYEDVVVKTQVGIALYDITDHVNRVLEKSDVKEGVANVISRHTTTALTINECEPRLMDDVRQFLARLVPADYPYLHNDLQFREVPVPFVGVWPDDEPINAHSHLIAMLLGQSDSVPVHEGKLVLGTYQSVIFLELDGMPERERKIGIQVMGISS